MAEKKRGKIGSGSGNGSGSSNLVIKELRNLCVPMDSVKPHPKNPRVNDEAAVKLAELIKAHGFRVPIVIDAQGVIRAGHTRYKAMRILEAKEIPAVRQEFLSEAAARAFAIADNKSSEWSEWDNSVLFELMNSEELRPLASMTGFTDEGLASLIKLPTERIDDKFDDLEPGDISTGSELYVMVIITPQSVYDASLKERLMAICKEFGADFRVRTIKKKGSKS